MPGRNWSATQYRYTHDGHEKENELFTGAQSSEHWMYDSRIAKRWGLDPIVKPFESSYATFGNNPILFVDQNGLDWFYYQKFGEASPRWHWHNGSVIGIITQDILMLLVKKP
jgi:hypothetical protein